MAYVALREREPDTVGKIQLEYGEFSQDFESSISYRIDVSGEEPTIEFYYPDSNEEEPPTTPIYRKPLSQEVDELKQLVADLANLKLGV